MSFNNHMKDYFSARTSLHIDELYSIKHNLCHPPVEIEVSPTSKCNQRCRYCYTHNRENLHSMEQVTLLKTFSQTADYGVKAIIIQGTGEPLLNKYLPEAISIGNKKNVEIALTTNGTLLTPQLQNKILDKLVYVKFSCLDNSPQRYSFEHGCSPSHWKVLTNNIESAAELRKKNNLNTALWCSVYATNHNFAELPEICRFFKNIGIDYITIFEAQYSNYSPNSGDIPVSISKTQEEIENIRQKCLEHNDDNFHVAMFNYTSSTFHSKNTPNSSWEKDLCKGTNLFSIVSSHGEVYPCWRFWGKTKYSFGNINTYSFKEIWEGNKRQEIYQYLLTTPPKGDECLVCSHAKINHFVKNILNNNNKWKNYLYT